MNNLQEMINKRADARLQDDLDTTYPIVSEKFKNVMRDGREWTTRIKIGDCEPISVSFTGGLMSKVHEQLKEQFREQYRQQESAKFLNEVTAMRNRFEELTQEELA